MKKAIWHAPTRGELDSAEEDEELLEVVCLAFAERGATRRGRDDLTWEWPWGRMTLPQAVVVAAVLLFLGLVCIADALTPAP